MCGGPRPDPAVGWWFWTSVWVGGLLGLDGCEVRMCDPCDPCARVSRVCPGSPQCLFTDAGTVDARLSPFISPFITHRHRGTRLRGGHTGHPHVRE